MSISTASSRINYTVPIQAVLTTKMLRNLIILAAVALLVLVIRNRIRNRRRQSSIDSKTVNSVQCAHCREYLPTSSALQQQGRFFCNTEHFHAWQQRGD